MKKTVFLFGTKGYLSKVLLSLLQSDWTVHGICGARQFEGANALKSKLSWFAKEVGLSVDQDLIYESPFKDLPEPFDIADSHGIQKFDIAELHDHRLSKYLSVSKPDMILVAGFPKLIPEQIYQKAKLGAFNFHPSLLPNYKGGTPNRWVVRDSAPETGITAHRLTDEFDAGEIVLNTKILVEKNDSWGDVETKVLEKLPAFTFDFLETCANGSPIASPQPQSLMRLLPSLRGSRQFIDWRLPATEIARLCQAMRPKSGGLALRRGVKICIWDFEQIGESRVIPSYGKIVRWPNDSGPIVSCGNGTFGQINSVLYNRKIRTPSFLKRKFKITTGDSFDLVNFDD